MNNTMQTDVIQINNVRVINPFTQTDTFEASVILENGKMVTSIAAQQTIDGSNLWLVPTFVDVCARLREPGYQQHGTLKSEGQAAKTNGILHVITPPDTKPILENGALLAGLKQKAFADGGIHLHVIGALTQGLKGEQPANMAGLKQGGCVAVSNANGGFANDEVILRCLEYAASLNLKVVFYPLQHSLAVEGCAHDGFMATRQGLAPIPRIAETVALAKQLQMVEEVGISAHFGLLSCAESVELIARAKQKGLDVSASVAMHQLHLTDCYIDGFNAMAHVLPPLREESDRLALLQGVKDGVIDAICSHHEPLSNTAKLAPFADTAPGISAFDTFVPLGIKLVQQGALTSLQWLSAVVTKPANIFNLPHIAAQSGWVLINPNEQYTLSPNDIHSAGKNTPLMGEQLTGKVLQVFV